MEHRTSLLLLLALCCYFSAAIQIFAATACTYGADKCLCKSKGIEYNLRPLMDSKGGKDLSFVDVAGGYTYYIQPCNLPLTTPSLSLCAHNLVSCQYSTDKKYAYGLGAIDQFTVDGKPDDFNLENWYIDADSVHRHLHLHVNCSQDEANLAYNGHSGTTIITYSFTLLTRHVCKGGGGGGGSVSISVSLSVGSVMVIIFFALLVAYLVGGALFLKFGKKAQGREVVPNYGFWTAIPLLIKDGFSFTFQCCIRNPAYGKI